MLWSCEFSSFVQIICSRRFINKTSVQLLQSFLSKVLFKIISAKQIFCVGAVLVRMERGKKWRERGEKDSLIKEYQNNRMMSWVLLLGYWH